VARYTGPKCKLCRREGIKLFLKGLRCDTAKCAFERRDYPPGMAQTRRRKITPYGLQLREKQKVKRYYGLYENQFRLVFQRAERARGNTGENLLIMLERRLDNTVAALGFATSHCSARQMVRHGHILVNGKRVSIPSQLVEVDDVITLANNAKTRALAESAFHVTQNHPLPAWLEMTGGDQPTGKVLRFPMREDVALPVQEQLIVELLSK
jgi:small subunit ribosomal protein S4